MGWSYDETMSLSPALLFSIHKHLVDIIKAENGVGNKDDFNKQKKLIEMNKADMEYRIKKAKAQGKNKLSLDKLIGQSFSSK